MSEWNNSMSDQTPIDVKSAVPLVVQKKVERVPLDVRAIIAYWMMTSTFVLLVLCWWKPPASDQQVLSLLLGGYITSGFVLSMQYWNGSSKGSDDKSKAINAQMTGESK